MAVVRAFHFVKFCYPLSILPRASRRWGNCCFTNEGFPLPLPQIQIASYNHCRHCPHQAEWLLQGFACFVFWTHVENGSFALQGESFPVYQQSFQLSVTESSSHSLSFSSLLLCGFCPIQQLLTSSHILESHSTFVFQFSVKLISTFFSPSSCFCTFSGEGGKFVKPTSKLKCNESLPELFAQCEWRVRGYVGTQDSHLCSFKEQTVVLIYHVEFLGPVGHPGGDAEQLVFGVNLELRERGREWEARLIMTLLLLLPCIESLLCFKEYINIISCSYNKKTGSAK